jgi:hypothetical protein
MASQNTKRLVKGALAAAAVCLVLIDPSPPMLIALIAVFAELSN